MCAALMALTKAMQMRLTHGTSAVGGPETVNSAFACDRQHIAAERSTAYIGCTRCRWLPTLSP